jgi:methylglutaconyl-CoA hydratase
VVWALNRPKSKNAFSRQLSAELAQAFEEVRFDKNVRCLIVRSTSPGIFCAGADLKERRYIPEEEVGVFVARGRKFFREFQEMPIPTIAALDGFALGGGLEWAMGHDLRTAADEAKMGVTETKLAIIPGGGGTQNLTRLVGVGKAKELAFTARMIDGKEAERIGLVNKSGNFPNVRSKG